MKTLRIDASTVQRWHYEAHVARFAGHTFLIGSAIPPYIEEEILADAISSPKDFATQLFEIADEHDYTEIVASVPGLITGHWRYVDGKWQTTR